MQMKFWGSTLLGLATACAGPQTPPSTLQSNATIVLGPDIEWAQLNPARGDQSPQAGTLWGDRNGKAATGYLLKPVDGFRSPPHIHNVSYRAVVIRGLIHNDHPDAPDQWMSKGAFWTQPKGQAHITAAKGSDTLAYIEIDEGPYLVWPVDRSFESEEQARNTAAKDIQWATLSADIDSPATLAQLWGGPMGQSPHGSFVQMPANFSGQLRSLGRSFRGVLVEGALSLPAEKSTDERTLSPGAYFESIGPGLHKVTCKAGTACILYVRAEGRFELRRTGD